MITTPEITPTRSSSSDFWVAWYDSLAAFFGKKDARAIFKQYWEDRGKGTGANTVSFREKMSTRGISITADGVFGEMVDAATGAVDSVFDGVSSVLKIGKTAAYVAIGLSALVVVGVVYSFMKRGAEFNPVTKSFKV
jgi:hypothetical protein